MLKREDWIEYPREIPVAPGWYIVWIVRGEDGIGFASVVKWDGKNFNTAQLMSRKVTHWSDYQPPIVAKERK